jgi:hypothetical protein
VESRTAEKAWDEEMFKLNGGPRVTIIAQAGASSMSGASPTRYACEEGWRQVRAIPFLGFSNFQERTR